MNILGFRLVAGNKEYIGKCEKFEENASDVMQQTREEFGRYFGIFRACVNFFL
jgi:hypothetical protein